MQSLSVLIPAYNCCCLPLVEQLHRQLEQAAIPYEIIVGDDGSTDTTTIQSNQPINTLSHCRYIVRTENTGRAVIRIFLAQTAQYEFLLLIDSDMSVVSESFIQNYLAAECQTVVDGGIIVCGDPDDLKGNLRYLYEKAEEPHHTVSERQRSPHQHIHTANLLIRRDLMLQYPFDNRFRHYGYEDVLLGKTLHQHHVPILHIDNPLGMCTFETNAAFVAKTEEGLRTLYTFRKELRGYSRLLTFVSGIHLAIVKNIIRFWHQVFNKAERRNLCGSRPSLWVFKLYRLGYFLCLK
jgi:glycosyltransferase involved in cell wall biosynthesis